MSKFLARKIGTWEVVGFAPVPGKSGFAPIAWCVDGHTAKLLEAFMTFADSAGFTFFQLGQQSLQHPSEEAVKQAATPELYDQVDADQVEKKEEWNSQETPPAAKTPPAAPPPPPPPAPSSRTSSKGGNKRSS